MTEEATREQIIELIDYSLKALIEPERPMRDMLIGTTLLLAKNFIEEHVPESHERTEVDSRPEQGRAT